MYECRTYRDQRVASDFISAHVSTVPTETRGWRQIFVFTRVSAEPTETKGWRQIFPGTGVTGECEHVCGCWEPNSEPALLSTELSFCSQALKCFERQQDTVEKSVPKILKQAGFGECVSLCTRKCSKT